MKKIDLSLPFAALSVEQVIDLLQQIIGSVANENRHEVRPQFLGIREFCAITGYSPSTVYKLVNENKVPFHRAAHGGRKIFFKTDEVEDWLTQNAECTVSDYCKKMDLKLVH